MISIAISSAVDGNRPPAFYSSPAGRATAAGATWPTNFIRFTHTQGNRGAGSFAWRILVDDV
jgi:hypothetical protein